MRRFSTIAKTELELERIRDYIQKAKGETSIMAACEALNIPYLPFMQRTTREQRQGIKDMCVHYKSRNKLKAPLPDKPNLQPLPPRSVSIPKPSVVDPFNFPRAIYRLHKNLIGTWNTVKMRFFIHTECEYFVTGYEYELSEFPGVFRPDIHFHSFDTDVNVALSTLRQVVDTKLDHDIQDKVLGLIRYTVNPHTGGRPIEATTKVKAPDGEYTAFVANEIGCIKVGDVSYDFVLPDPLPVGSLRCKVEMEKVYLFI